MGVAHLAYTLSNQIYQLQGRELDIKRSDVKCAEVAGALSQPPAVMRLSEAVTPVLVVFTAARAETSPANMRCVLPRILEPRAQKHP